MCRTRNAVTDNKAREVLGKNTDACTFFIYISDAGTVLLYCHSTFKIINIFNCYFSLKLLSLLLTASTYLNITLAVFDVSTNWENMWRVHPKSKHIYPVQKYSLWLCIFPGSCFFFFFFFCYENYGLTLRLPTSVPFSTGSTSYSRAENTHHWPATVSMETTASFPSWESVNSKWTWDDSYKLFPNLVIFHFHAAMDIGLQVCWEWRGEVFMVWHFTGVHGMVQYGLSSPADVLWNALENHHK